MIGRLTGLMLEKQPPLVLVDVQGVGYTEDVINNDDGSIEVITPPYELVIIKSALEKMGFKAELATVTMKPDNEVVLTGDNAVKMQKLLDALENFAALGIRSSFLVFDICPLAVPGHDAYALC